MNKDLDLLSHEIALAKTYTPIKSPVANPYIAAATSQNTRKAYQADIRHYEKWGGQLPASQEAILTYLQTFAPQLNPRTLARRLVAIRHWHTYQGFPDPTYHPLVSKTLAGIMRVHGKPKDKAPPLLPEQLLKMVNHLIQEKSLRAYRDNALLQLAFFGAFRGSEVIAIRYEHIKWQKEGMDILIPHSKTDQTHEGTYCAIPIGNEHLCPVRAIKRWLDQSGIQEGYLFRRIYRDNRMENEPLIPLSVSHILRKRAHEAQLHEANQFSSHSLRRGLATAASREGASLSAIMRQGRWKNINTVLEYIEAAKRFEENAASSVIKNIQTVF